MISQKQQQMLQACETMQDKVAMAFRVAEMDKATRPLVTRQSRYVVACLALTYFFREIGQQETSNSFQVLGEALYDLSQGVDHPLFKIKGGRKRGRQKDPTYVWRTRANVCTGLALMIESGMRDEEAARWAIGKYRNELQKLLRPSSDLAKSLKTWQKAFKMEEVPNSVAQGLYRENTKKTKEAKQNRTGAQMRKIGERLIKDAIDRAALVV
jgi:hypothetical protein